ncbi:MAG: ABC transporter permease [Chloroflexi bacterium]|jgi:ABC-type polysaccharide/polyol phosphate export permease|nr:ABC transporter permease [Chloroflexota bacterium]
MTTHSTELTVGRPRRGSIGTIFESLTSLVERRRLVWYLTISEIRNKGTNSLLGNVWWFLDPALQLFVYFLLVSVIFQQAQPAILLFLGSAILPWKWFTAALASATTSVRGREQVMRQIAFPHIVLPAASVLASVGNFLFALVPLGALYLLYPDRLTPWALAVLPVAAVQFLWTIPAVIALSAVAVFFRDISNFIPHGLRIWFYLSPALFPIETLRAIGARHPWFNFFVDINPFTWIFSGYRDALYYGRSPEWGALGILALASIPVTLLTIYLFRRVSPLFVKVL